MIYTIIEHQVVGSPHERSFAELDNDGKQKTENGKPLYRVEKWGCNSRRIVVSVCDDDKKPLLDSDGKPVTREYPWGGDVPEEVAMHETRLLLDHEFAQPVSEGSGVGQQL